VHDIPGAVVAGHGALVTGAQLGVWIGGVHEFDALTT
jgi:hypothetical protein